MELNITQLPSDLILYIASYVGICIYPFSVTCKTIYKVLKPKLLHIRDNIEYCDMESGFVENRVVDELVDNKYYRLLHWILSVKYVTADEYIISNAISDMIIGKNIELFDVWAKDIKYLPMAIELAIVEKKYNTLSLLIKEYKSYFDLKDIIRCHSCNKFHTHKERLLCIVEDYIARSLHNISKYTIDNLSKLFKLEYRAIIYLAEPSSRIAIAEKIKRYCRYNIMNVVLESAVVDEDVELAKEAISRGANNYTKVKYVYGNRSNVEKELKILLKRNNTSIFNTVHSVGTVCVLDVL